jgi:hypothetical protein
MIDREVKATRGCLLEHPEASRVPVENQGRREGIPEELHDLSLGTTAVQGEDLVARSSHHIRDPLEGPQLGVSVSNVILGEVQPHLSYIPGRREELFEEWEFMVVSRNQLGMEAEREADIFVGGSALEKPSREAAQHGRDEIREDKAWQTAEEVDSRV